MDYNLAVSSKTLWLRKSRKRSNWSQHFEGKIEHFTLPLQLPSRQASKPPRVPAPTPSLPKGFLAFQATKWQLTIEYCGEYQVQGSDFQLGMAQLHHHDRRIYRSRHGNESTSFKPTRCLRSGKPTAPAGATPSRLKTLESNVYLPILSDTLRIICNTKVLCLCGREVPSTRTNAGRMREAPEAGSSKRGFNTFSFCGCLELPEPVRNADKNVVLKMSPVRPTKSSFDSHNMIFNASPIAPTSYSAGDHHGPGTPIHFSLYLLE
ncbi:uncharacterized protein EAE97_011330 [Botrytis byssoidea]|uniref:Uncharacterized protein n=1 Tax=Botrytis byssoidea TaxID=139641 RepID=A0A9P5LKQ5_9HELO|nr:uncharacterized protein EAE97_011330 [Botrytis byssoidea]KAF7921062.1 hypothetical protein EAE97_011330 [Botrytis byssoidea]